MRAPFRYVFLLLSLAQRVCLPPLRAAAIFYFADSRRGRLPLHCIVYYGAAASAILSIALPPSFSLRRSAIEEATAIFASAIAA